jgi:hypothetical protein
MPSLASLADAGAMAGAVNKLAYSHALLYLNKAAAAKVQQRASLRIWNCISRKIYDSAARATFRLADSIKTALDVL